VKATTKNTILIWSSFLLGSWFGYDFEKAKFSQHYTIPFSLTFSSIMALLVARLDIFGVHNHKIMKAQNLLITGQSL
jgi:hypothetical protein